MNALRENWEFIAKIAIRCSSNVIQQPPKNLNRLKREVNYKMSAFLYKNYNIIAAAERDSLTGKYKPIAHITWR